MPKSSRHNNKPSHKQSKRSSRDYHSDSDSDSYSDVKMKEDYVASKRRKARADVAVTDRRNESKRKNVNSERPLQDELRNPKLDKKVEKQMRRGDGVVEKEKYLDDKRDVDDRRLSSRSEPGRDGRYKDGSNRDKYIEDVDRDSRRRDGKQREDVDREKRYQEDKHRDDRASRDHPSNKSDSKRMRDAGNVAESGHKRSRTQNISLDGSPVHDDQDARYKDDKGKRRSDDKEDRIDVRSRSTKEESSEAKKKSINNRKVESVTDRVLSHPRIDVDSNTSHNNKRTSPSTSSDAGKEQSRFLKEAELNNRDSLPKDREWHNARTSKEATGASVVPENASVFQPMKKAIHKDESHFGDLSGERFLDSDAHALPMQLGKNSPLATSTDCKHMSRVGVAQSVDVEESGQRAINIEDAKDLYGNEGKGVLELPLEKPPVDEISQAVSASSPFRRPSHLPGKFRPHFPPRPPVRAGVSGGDNRVKSNYLHKRTDDFNVGRAQGNSRRGVPNWSSSVTNGFIPFQHDPPPLCFHPVMPQFSAPPMFGVRPSMELNHSGVPFCIPNADRYSRHRHPYGFPDLVDDLHPPPLNGWEASNGVIGGEAHIYGRPDWDHDRTAPSSQGWESSEGMGKGKSGDVMTEIHPVPIKEDHSVHAPVDEVWTGQSSQQAWHEQNQPDLQAENINIGDQFTGVPGKEISEGPKTNIEMTPILSKKSGGDDACCWHVYLSKLDISADLTHPELYSQCMSIIDLEQNTNVDEDSKLLNLEGVIETRVKIFNNTSSASLFAAINDSVFQRAMSFYKKQREEFRAILLPSLSNGKKLPTNSVENLEVVPVPVSDQEKAVAPMSTSDERISGELVPPCYSEEAEGVVSSSKLEKSAMSISFQKVEAPLLTLCEKAGELIPANCSGRLEGPSSSKHAVNMDVDMVFNETSNRTFEDEFSTIQKLSWSAIEAPGLVEDLNKAGNCRGNYSVSGTEEEQGHLNFLDMPSEANERVISESIESGVVNLSWIHHSPESTH